MKIIGNVRPSDEYMHPLGPEPTFNESMYFNFFDRTRATGGFVRLGNRANEGHAEMTVTLFLPDGRVLFTYKRPTIADNDAFDAGGARFTVVEPTEALRTTYEGGVVELREPRDMADPRAAFTGNPTRRVSLDLHHRAVGPLYGNVHDPDEADAGAAQQFAKAHYEQHMHVSGTLTIEDETFPIDGNGLRDHSWGPRSWQAIQAYEWLTINFDDDLGLMVSRIQRDADTVRAGGVVVRGEQLTPITDVQIDAEYEANGLYHRAVRAHVVTKDGEALDLRGAVRSFIPLRNRRGGRTTHIGEGMTEWRLGDRVGYGLAEFLRQVD